MVQAALWVGRSARKAAAKTVKLTIRWTKKIGKHVGLPLSFLAALLVPLVALEIFWPASRTQEVGDWLYPSWLLMVICGFAVWSLRKHERRWQSLSGGDVITLAAFFLSSFATLRTALHDSETPIPTPALLIFGIAFVGSAILVTGQWQSIIDGWLSGAQEAVDEGGACRKRLGLIYIAVVKQFQPPAAAIAVGTSYFGIVLAFPGLSQPQAAGVLLALIACVLGFELWRDRNRPDTATVAGARSSDPAGAAAAMEMKASDHGEAGSTP